jgi:hypothetical protein
MDKLHDMKRLLVFLLFAFALSSCENVNPDDIKDRTVDIGTIEAAQLKSSTVDSLDMFRIQTVDYDFLYKKNSNKEHTLIAVYSKLSPASVFLISLLVGFLIGIFVGIGIANP